MILVVTNHHFLRAGCHISDGARAELRDRSVVSRGGR
jgi:hypothetical protein